MARKKADLTTFGFAQLLDTEYWAYNDDFKYLNNKDLQGLGENIKNRLNQKEDILEELYLVIHDKDHQNKWNEQIGDYVLEPKKEHIHGVAKFKKGKSLPLEDIATLIGVEPQYIDRPKPGRYSYNNMLSYLIHIKNIDKAQYKESEVVTILGEDYQEIYNINRENWIKARAKVTTKKAKLEVDELEEMVLSGEVTRQQVLLTDRYFTIYSRNAVRIDKAFEVYAERKAYKAMQAMERGDFLLTVYFITGQSRSGKSYFSDKLSRAIEEEMSKNGPKWTTAQAAATNSLDDYLAEEILVLDDLRGASMTASDWLKLLDPERLNIVSARYKNKRLASRVIIINSTKEPLEFFYYLKKINSNESEAMDQFFARIFKLVKVIRLDDESRKYLVSSSERVDKHYVLSPRNSVLEMNYKFVDEATYEDIDKAVDDLVESVKERNDINDKKSIEVLDGQLSVDDVDGLPF